MEERKLHPREEPYRWAIERLDTAFGRERVRVTPRQHHHVIKVAVGGGGDGAGRAQEITLRSPTYDINRQQDREAFLAHWIAEAREPGGGASKGKAAEAREPGGGASKGKAAAARQPAGAAKGKGRSGSR